MKNLFPSFTKCEIKNMGDDIQNVVFEMFSVCIANNTRIIIEQNEVKGLTYLMVDFSPTDGSNDEFFGETMDVCVVTNIKNGDSGDLFERFRNYIDAVNWLCGFLRTEEYVDIYVETY